MTEEQRDSFESPLIKTTDSYKGSPSEVLTLATNQPSEVVDDKKQEMSPEERIHFLEEQHKRDQELIKALKIELETDKITGLPNSVVFGRDIEEIKKNAMDSKLSRLTYFMIDADYFKPINDTYGHKIGDSMIRVYAQLIGISINRMTTLYRRNKGDEFIGLIRESTQQDIDQLQENLNENVAFFNSIDSPLLNQRDQLSDQQKEILKLYQGLPEGLKYLKEQNLLLPISLSFGSSSCTFPDKSIYHPNEKEKIIDQQINDLFEKADTNMYRNKGTKGDRVKKSVLMALNKNLELTTDPDQKERIKSCIDSIR